jgi:hypothetical protein
MHHPHLHCVVPGGGLSPDKQRWIACRRDFFLPVRVLSRFFRRRFVEMLEHAFDTDELNFFSALANLQNSDTFQQYLVPVRKKEWVVYAKPPFAGPEQVLDYVGRYTHRVAISNNRLLDIEDGHVRFRWKDYADDNQQKSMTLTADEFIRRLTRCRDFLNMPAQTTTPDEPDAPRDYRRRYEALTGKSLHQCPACREGCMQLIGLLPRGKRVAVIDTS